MNKTTATIRFRAKLWGPAAPKGASWTFLILPKNASARLPTRSMTTVQGTINDYPFRASLAPDGQRSHWLKVTRKMREGAGAQVGDVVTLEIVSTGKEPEPKIPADLRKALAAAPQARALWSDITPLARRDWIHWITSARRPETRRAGSTMPAKCWRPGSDASAASIGPESMVRISRTPKRWARALSTSTIRVPPAACPAVRWLYGKSDPKIKR